MKQIVSHLRARAAHGPEAESPLRSTGGGDDTLGRGMDVALTLAAFLGLGWLIDRWLGVFPLATITLVVFAAVGTFIRMKYTYDARMERLEAERMARRLTRPDRTRGAA